MNDQNSNSVGMHENVLLLAMSTLPQTPKVNTYQIEEEGKILYFKSYSQMEPHTKYVLYKLAEKHEKLDRIVILESAKARTEKPEKWNQETATSLFDKRIHHYLNRTENVKIRIDDELSELQESTVDAEFYQKFFPEVIMVDLEESVFFWKAAQAIRSAEKKHAVHLYMDMQGGDRNAVAQMNAIAELLERQGVIIKGRYANDFDPRRKPPLHTIREAGKEYRTYDLISAMDIFAQYGWGDKLDQYFGGSIGKASKESRLIEAIKLASSAISRCSGEKFDAAVRKIEELESEFENPETVTEMDVVYQDIREDYKPLFNPPYRYVEQIRWCLNKNFFQQALTIFEAKMPYEFVHSGLIYYMTKNRGDSGRIEFLESCERMYWNMSQNNRYRLKDLNHYLLKDYCWKKDYKQNRNIFRDPQGILSFGLEEEKVIPLLDKYRMLCLLRNQINHASEETHNADGFFCYMKEKYNWIEEIEKQETDYKKELQDFLDEWQVYAAQVPEKIRNQVVDLS